MEKWISPEEWGDPGLEIGHCALSSGSANMGTPIRKGEDATRLDVGLSENVGYIPKQIAI